MTCIVLVKSWWQMLISVSTSVCGGYASCLFAGPWSISVPQTEMVATVHHQKEKWTPMSGGGDRGDDGLGIRKY